MNGVCRGRLAGGATLRRRRVVGEDAAPPEVEEHRGRNDRDHLAGLAHRPAHARGIQVLAHAVGGGQAERAAPGEDDGVDPVDEVARVEQVGLPGAGGAAADVDAGDRAVWRGQDHRRAREPAGLGARRVPDPYAADVGQRVRGARAGGHCAT